jgi:hypothetical protein
MNDAQKRGRRTLILIALMFALPIVGAMYMYFSGSTLNPVVTTQHGEFIDPPVSLDDAALNDGEPAPQFRKVWSMVVLAEADCDDLCMSTLENIRQVRLSLGPKMTRMQTVYLPASADAVPAQLADNHPKLIIADPARSSDWRAAIGAYDNGEVFLVDPLGNVMMRYEPGTGMGEIREDVKKLLQLSGIG